MNAKKLLFALATTTASNTFAAPVIDQSNLADITNYNQLLWTNQAREQSFTVGTTGSLTGLDVAMLNDGYGIALQASLYRFESAPSWYNQSGNFSGVGSFLGSVSLTTDPNKFAYTGASYIHFDLSSLGVTAAINDILAFAITSSHPNSPVLLGTIGDQYWGGFSFAGTGGTGKDADLLFRTYVDPVANALPTPSTLPLALSAIALMFVTTRGRSAIGRNRYTSYR